MPILGSRGAASLKGWGFAGVGRPAAPVNVTADKDADGNFTVRFSLAYDGGSPITSVTAVSSPGNITATTNSPSSGTVSMTGLLTLGTTYTFVVYATNAIGNSVNSQASNSLLAAKRPGIPTIGTISVNSLNSVSVPFTAGADNGSTITSFRLFGKIGSTSMTPSPLATLNQSTSGTFSVNGLSPNTTYTFDMDAVNGVASSGNSASKQITIPLPSYTISTNLFTSGGTEYAGEGDSVRIDVLANLTASPKTVYWRISGTGITLSDFTGLTALTGSLSVSSDATSSVSFGVAADATTEGSETFTFEFFTDSARTTSWATTGLGANQVTVSGNPRTIQIGDTSLTPITYSVSSPSSVNEGSNANFTVTTTGIGTTTLYWTTLHGSTNSSDLSPNSGSVSISGDSGSFSIYVNADATTEGSEYFYVYLRTGSTSGTIVYTAGPVYINDTSQTPLPTITGVNLKLMDSWYLTYPPNTSYKQRAAYLENLSAGNVSYSFSTPGLTRDATSSPSAASGTSFQGSGIYITFIAPHSQATVYVTLSKAGYQDTTLSLVVTANTVYSPYNFSRGFPQESGLSGTALTYAQQIAESVYETISTPYTATVNGVTGTWYGLGRRIDYSGASYWPGQLIANGWTPTSQAWYNGFFTAVNAAGAGNPDYDASRTSSKSFRTGMGYNKISDRP